MTSDGEPSAACRVLAGATAILWSASATGVESPVQVSAAQAMRAHARMTSIGADPCRPGAANSDEIVVCGRRESPYALPLYEPLSAGDGLMSGMDRELAVGIAWDTAASCRARGEACTKPLPLIGIPVGAGRKGGVRIGKD